MPVPNADFAIVPLVKVTDYLLNILHPVGGPKANWFISVGYDPEHPEVLAADLLGLIRHEQEFSSHQSPYGIKYIVRGRIRTPSGRIVNMLSVWVAEGLGEPPRLVTAYPAPGTEMEDAKGDSR